MGDTGGIGERELRVAGAARVLTDAAELAAHLDETPFRARQDGADALQPLHGRAADGQRG